jgi:hypothetical protein
MKLTKEEKQLILEALISHELKISEAVGYFSKVSPKYSELYGREMLRIKDLQDYIKSTL